MYSVWSRSRVGISFQRWRDYESTGVYSDSGDSVCCHIRFSIYNQYHTTVIGFTFSLDVAVVDFFIHGGI